MKKILIFSPPFGGHVTILNEFINQFASKYDIKFVITGWTNIKPDNESSKVPPIVFAKSTLRETDPSLWTFSRVFELLPSCLKIAREFQPDLIIYDFFSLEGVYVGRILNIPYWCSIPALIGPFSNRGYLRKKLVGKVNKNSLNLLELNYGNVIDSSEIESISDGLHVSGTRNLVWSYRSVVPDNFLENRKKTPYHFVGNIRGRYFPKIHRNNNPLIYISFGTVVMDNLWNQQIETRKKLQSFILQLSELWKDRKYEVIFISQGKGVLKKYPSNWHVFDRVDQIDYLSKADVFITHGGNNSFHEALIQQVPMIVIPFFGDQPLIANTIERLGIGIKLVKDSNIDTKKSKDFLNIELVERLDYAVNEVLSNKKYKKNFDKINLKFESLSNLLTQFYVKESSSFSRAS